MAVLSGGTKRKSLDKETWELMKFEWDEEKAHANLKKHGVSFDEAQTVFDDPLYVDFYDPDHSLDEHRYNYHRTVGSEAAVDCFVHRTVR